MDLFAGIVIVVLIVYSMFEEKPEEKAAREAAEREAYIKKQFRLAVLREQARKEREALEKQRKEREKPFPSSLECIQKQYASYSRIGTYCSCPQRFKLIYLDKKKGVGNRWLNKGKGSIFHKSVEAYLNSLTSRRIGELDYKEIVKNAFHLNYLSNSKNYWSHERKDREKRKRKIFRENCKFLCKTLPKNTEIIAVEKDLKFRVNEIKFYGIVDLVVRYPDGHVEIIDYKTGLIRPIKEQLEIYAIPFTKSKGLSSICFRIICVDRMSHYIWSLDKEGIIKSRKNILNIVNTIIDDSNFSPAISSACSQCSVRHECKYSEIYKESKQTSGKNNRLTRLTCAYEWKKATIPPNISVRSPNIRKDNGNRKTNAALSYSLSQAKKKYECSKTRRLIQIGEYHFVNHHGKRFCIDAFMQLYPKRAEQVIKAITNRKNKKLKSE